MKITLLFVLTYMVSYLTRVNFGAVIVEIAADTGIAASRLSLAVTGSFITYGLGQLISGYLGDRIQPKRLVALGLSATVAMNALIPFCRAPWQMTAAWCVNGFAQSLMWPPLVRLMVSLFSTEEYPRATVRVNYGGSLGTILVFLLSPLCILLAGWRLVFWAASGIGLCMLLCWRRFCPDVATVRAENDRAGRRDWQFLKSPLTWGIMAAIVLQGLLRDGVTTWMPSYISETFHLGSAVSILSGVLLPLFAILSLRVASAIYGRRPGEPLLLAGVIFLAGAAFAFLLLCFSGHQAIACALCMALLTGCMHGVNLILVCMLPVFFKGGGNVSTVSGVLNSCTYVGSAISTYGIARLAEGLGWKPTIAVWVFVALAGAGLCFLSIPAWRRRFPSSVS